MKQQIRVGLIGAGANTRLRHIPGLRAIDGVDIVAVCNRRAESTQAVASEFGIARTYACWEDLIDDNEIDAIVIGTWPYLHCPITLAALRAGKHVLTEARMSMNAAEARQMLAAAQQAAHLVAQVVPSPFGLKGHDVIVDLISQGFLGELREVRAYNLNGALADATAPLSWRQDSLLSGCNVLTLGIIHETLMRWVPQVVSVRAQATAHVATRIELTTGERDSVGTPDSVQVCAVLEGGAQASYHFSGAAPFGQAAGIDLFGSDGVLCYDLLTDRIRGSSRRFGGQPGRRSDLLDIPIPSDQARSWNVEAEFIAAIRDRRPIGFTTFQAGLAYMEFTEAVARSAASGRAISILSLAA